MDFREGDLLRSNESLLDVLFLVLPTLGEFLY